jgi:hypothetical protein
MSTLRGRLIDESKRPVADATLTAVGANGRPIVAAIDGEFYFLPLLEAGVYDWSAKARGHAPASGSVRVQGGTAVLDGPDIVLGTFAALSGRVAEQAGGDGLAGAAVTADGKVVLSALTDEFGDYRIREVPAGRYDVRVEPLPAHQPVPPRRVFMRAGEDRSGVDFLLPPVVPEVPTGPALPTGPAGPDPVASGPRPVESGPEPPPSGPAPVEPVPTGPVASGPEPQPPPDDPASRLLQMLREPAFSVDQPINEADAVQAAVLFPLAAVVFAGTAYVKVGDTRRRDVLGALTLFYGLQDKSLQRRLAASRAVWTEIEPDLKALRDELERLGDDVGFLEREARRQFNLGANNEVLGNQRFMQSFQRYVTIAADPRLRLDLRLEDASPTADKARVNEAVELLFELKGVIVELTRSLGRYGTIATRRANSDWARVAARALRVLRRVGEARFTEDHDDRNAYATLAAITGRDRDRQIVPLIVLARDGGALLRLAMDIYMDTRLALEDYSRDAVIALFQPPGDPTAYRTEALRARAAALRRYPLVSWQ